MALSSSCLHNAYLQILSELGLIGAAAFVWLLRDFFARNRQLNAAAAARYWAEQTGGNWDLRYLALGLEAANVANMMGAVFYASLFTPAFFTIWAVNRMLWAVTRPPSAVPVQQGRPPLARTIQLAPGR